MEDKKNYSMPFSGLNQNLNHFASHLILKMSLSMSLSRKAKRMKPKVAKVLAQVAVNVEEENDELFQMQTFLCKRGRGLERLARRGTYPRCIRRRKRGKEK